MVNSRNNNDNNNNNDQKPFLFISFWLVLNITRIHKRMVHGSPANDYYFSEGFFLFLGKRKKKEEEKYCRSMCPFCLQIYDIV